MKGKLRITSSGYDPEGPRVNDLTLAPSGTVPPRDEAEKGISLTPIGRRILVVPISGTVAASSLHVEAEQLPKELRLCCVLAVGPKVAETHARIVPGAPIYVKPYFGVELVVNGNLVVLIKPEDVHGLANFNKGSA